MNLSPSLSVIVCTFNGGSRIASAFASLAEQTLPAEMWELLVIDNASTDDTAAIANAWIGKVKCEMRVVSQPLPGKSHALDLAFKEARGKYFCIVDDDNLLAHDYLQCAVEFIDAHPEVGIIGGRLFPAFPAGVKTPSDFHRCAEHLACFDRGSDLKWNTSPPGAGMVGRTALFRRLYAEIGTYLPDRVQCNLGCCEDLEKGAMVRRLGWRTAHVPTLSLKHAIAPHRLRDEYVDALSCAAQRTSPWLDLVNGRSGDSPVKAATGPLIHDTSRALYYLALSCLPKSWDARLARSKHWRRFYWSRVVGALELLARRQHANALIQRLAAAGPALRPPTPNLLKCEGDCQPLSKSPSHAPHSIAPKALSRSAS